jgi:TolB-like protein
MRPADAVLALLLAARVAAGGTLQAQEPSGEPAAAPGVFRVAVLPFEYEEQDDSRIGQRIADLLSETLRLNPTLRIEGPDEVRSRAGDSLPRMSQLLNGEDASQLGRTLELDALVSGQAYALEGRFFVVAKVIGCASGQIFGTGADGAVSAPLPEIVEVLAPGVDDLLAERRPELLLPPARARQAEEVLAARVRALRRQKEPPPVIVLVAEPEDGSGKAGGAAQDRLSQRVRRIGMTARPQRAKDVVEWARELHQGRGKEVPGALRGQGIVLAMLLRMEPVGERGALNVARASADALWLDARDGSRLASASASRDAVGRGAEAAAAAAARRLAQAVFDESFAASLTRWEARHKKDEEAAPAPAAGS